MKALVGVLVVAVGASASEPTSVRVAVFGLQGVNVPSEALAFYAEHLGLNVRSEGVSVVTAREISTLLGFERQKQLMGCKEGTSACLAELGNALGVDAIIVGDVARFDRTYQVNVKALNPLDATVLASRTARVEGDVAALDAIALLGAQLSQALLESRGRPVDAALRARATASSGPGSIRAWGFIPLGVGVAAGAAGGILVALAKRDHAALVGSGSPLTELEAQALRASGTTKQGVGFALVAVGATSALVAGAIFLFGGPKDTAFALVPIQNGAVASFGMAF